MILTSEQYRLLSSYIGYGVVNKPLICFFGNESGCAPMKIDDYLPMFFKNLETMKNNTLDDIYDLPVSSIFLQFIARLMLAIEHKDEKWFGELTGPGKAFINNYIMTRFSKEDTCVFNLRPLPRPTERVWPYENINEKEYYKNWNFLTKTSRSDEFKDLRMNIFKEKFAQLNETLIIGVGDKENKKAFFEKIYDCEFTQFSNFYYNSQHKIILSNYFDFKHGIKLTGLQTLYRFIKSNQLV